MYQFGFHTSISYTFFIHKMWQCIHRYIYIQSYWRSFSFFVREIDNKLKECNVFSRLSESKLERQGIPYVQIN